MGKNDPESISINIDFKDSIPQILYVKKENVPKTNSITKLSTYEPIIIIINLNIKNILNFPIKNKAINILGIK
ncbi:hypothetical protein, partial [Streptobacillus moniliformis]|uniref:hypothetical protein n=1 Tax=Streptobacillus moniliformis TaxID=34105 RepID=UPI000AFCA935